ncbi:MAG: caspase family protein [Pseudomonadota bacterium]
MSGFSRFIACLALCALAAMPALAQTGKRIALLVGVGSYQNFGASGALEGPGNDVVSMQSVLVRRLGVAEKDIRVLADAQATRANILTELRALSQRSAPGDLVIVYFSGHGTSRLDVDPAKAYTAVLPYSTGAFLAHDFSEKRPADGMIVGRTDLQPVIRALEAGGRDLWVISDSCFSGQAVRSLAAAVGNPDGLPGRFIPSAFSDKGSAIAANQGMRVAPDPYPYRRTLFMAASAEGEIARDIPARFLARYPTLDGKPHGAFTDALLRVLDGQLFADYDGNGRLDYAEIHAAVTQFAADRGYGQAPQRLPALTEDTQQLASRTLLSVGGATATAPRRMPGPLVVNTGDAAAAAVEQALRGLSGLEVNAAAAAPDLRLAPSRSNPDTLELRNGAGDLVTRFSKSAQAQEWLGTFLQFAWHKRIRGLGEQGRRALLKAEIHPSQFGGNFILDDRVQFVVSPQQATHLLLINCDAQGRVSVLYPGDANELAPLRAGAPVAIPEKPLTVVEPLGMDVQLLFGFDTAWPELRQLAGLQNLAAGDARLRLLEQLLAKAAGKYTMASTELRVLPKPTQ